MSRYCRARPAQIGCQKCALQTRRPNAVVATSDAASSVSRSTSGDLLGRATPPIAQTVPSAHSGQSVSLLRRARWANRIGDTSVAGSRAALQRPTTRRCVGNATARGSGGGLQRPPSRHRWPLYALVHRCRIRRQPARRGGLFVAAAFVVQELWATTRLTLQASHKRG
jgi:hypothetical protein